MGGEGRRGRGGRVVLLLLLLRTLTCLVAKAQGSVDVGLAGPLMERRSGGGVHGRVVVVSSHFEEGAATPVTQTWGERQSMRQQGGKAIGLEGSLACDW